MYSMGKAFNQIKVFYVNVFFVTCSREFVESCDHMITSR